MSFGNILILVVLQAIDEYFKMLSHTSKSSTIYGMLKLLPLWVVRLALGSGLLRLATNLFSPVFTRPLLEVVRGVTSNKDLQTMFMYCWGDYGCLPSRTTFVMQVGGRSLLIPSILLTLPSPGNSEPTLYEVWRSLPSRRQQ